jgi:hypothetical protein
LLLCVWKCFAGFVCKNRCQFLILLLGANFDPQRWSLSPRGEDSLYAPLFF